MWKVLALVLVGVVLSGCASGPPADPNNICRILADERGWKKDARKAYKRWGLPPHIGFAFIHRESTFDAKAKPERKKLLGVVPRRSMKRGLITKRALGDGSLNEMTWAMRWILLVGTTTPVIGVLGYPRATPIACISPITAVTVVMLEVHGRSLLRLRATQKKPLDRLLFTSASLESAVLRVGRAFSAAGGAGPPAQ